MELLKREEKKPRSKQPTIHTLLIFCLSCQWSSERNVKRFLSIRCHPSSRMGTQLIPNIPESKLFKSLRIYGFSFLIYSKLLDMESRTKPTVRKRRHRE